MAAVDYLRKLNHHASDDNISLDEATHTYSIQGVTNFISTTTLIHTLFEQFDDDKIINNMMRSKNWHNSKYYGMTKDEIKQIWNTTKIEASTAGTKLHADIEQYYNKVLIDNDTIEFSYFISFYNDFKDLLIPYRTEWTVYDSKLKIAGSIDMVFLNKSETERCGHEILDIYDWKRSKEIVKSSNFNKWSTDEELSHLPDTNYWHYALQLNVYKYLLETNYNKKIGKMVLVCLHPNNTNNSYKLFEVPNLQSEIEKLMKKMA